MSDVFVCCVFRRNTNKHADENGYGNEQQRDLNGYGSLQILSSAYLVHVGHKVLQLLQPLADPRPSFLNVRQRTRKTKLVSVLTSSIKAGSVAPYIAPSESVGKE
jgi:hypothetical protein